MVFCPYSSDPAKDKFTLFWSVEEFEKEHHQGYVYTSETTVKMRYQKDIYDLRVVDGAVKFADASVKANEQMLGLVKMIDTVKENYSYLIHI
jgi:hypothetical protein